MSIFLSFLTFEVHKSQHPGEEVCFYATMCVLAEEASAMAKTGSGAENRLRVLRPRFVGLFGLVGVDGEDDELACADAQLLGPAAGHVVGLDEEFHH